jgi:LacI family transcriptional regulator, galactose operon repressor
MKITHSQIAKKLKVDRTTVSKVLSGYQLDRFSDDVIEKIQNTAFSLGYKPKKFKSSLDITFIFPDYAGMLQYYSYPQRTLQTIIGISECIAGTSNRFHLAKYSDKIDQSVLYGDAFLLWEMSDDIKLQNAIIESDKEFLILNRAGKQYDGSFVVHDYDFSAKMSIDILLKANHQKIAYVGIPPANHPDLEYGIMRSYMDKAKGLSMGDFYHFENDNTLEIEETARQIIKKGYTAFIASNDNKAYKIINAMLKMGIKIPEDISVIGNHKIETCFDLPVDLTSFITPWTEIGRRGAELLLSRSKLGDDVPRKTVQESLKPELYPGKTVRSI